MAEPGDRIRVKLKHWSRAYVFDVVKIRGERIDMLECPEFPGTRYGMREDFPENEIEIWEEAGGE